MKRIIFYLLLLVGIEHLHAQNTIGVPQIVNYNKQSYGAGSQNWNITQDETGILYFANNDGLLSFDGTYWRIYPLPNKTIVRSVLAVGDKIFVGGQGEIGYFSPNVSGDLAYTSLNPFITATDNDFADVWNIVAYNDVVFFRTNYKLLEWNNNSIKVHRSSNWGYLGVANGLLLARQNDVGLVYYENGEWKPKIKSGTLPGGNMMLRSIVEMNGDSILLVTLFDGLFVLNKDTLTPLNTDVAKQLRSRSISSACKLPGNRIALATNLGGCTIIDTRGNFVQSFTRSEGIQNNNVLSVLSDRDGNIWLGLDNGIDLVAGSNSIRNIFPDGDDRHAGYTSIIHNNRLYLGVATGVFSVALDNKQDDISYTLGSFDFIRNTEGQVWTLSVVNDMLLMGHNKGAFILEGATARAIDTRMGFWGFQQLVPGQPESMIVAGTYNGISFANPVSKNNIQFAVNTKVESARFVAIGNDVIWIAHPYKGLYKILFDKNGIGEASRYEDKQKILSGNHNKIFKLRDRIILSTDNGIFEYDHKSKDFVPATWLRQLIGEAPVGYIKRRPVRKYLVQPPAANGCTRSQFSRTAHYRLS
ncbi:MAG: hypothetical protein NVV59_20430 [Chitinophagaceae bacterium]|nr:hypothetical protein [Chitinophagaceae bacterium]